MIIDQCVFILQTSMNVKMKLIHHALLLLNALTLKAATNVSILILTSWQKMEEHALVMLVNLLSIKTFSVLFYNAVKIIKLTFIEELLTYVKNRYTVMGIKIQSDSVK